MINEVVITDAWFEHKGKILLNPALKPYEFSLLSMKHTWLSAEPETPLSWYANQSGISPSSLVASLTSGTFDEDVQQVWIASPYHAKLTRSSLRVMPDSMLDWSTTQAKAVCDALNPLLSADGLQFIQLDEVLLLVSNQVWDVDVPSFASVSGKSLPDRPLNGTDAGRWARLLSEIQMTLHQASIITPNGLDVQGLWLWAGAAHVHDKVVDLEGLPLTSVATKNIYLNAALNHLGKQQDATMVISEAEHLPMLLNSNLPHPKRWLLLGDGKAVKCTQSGLSSLMHKVKARKWKGMS